MFTDKDPSSWFEQAARHFMSRHGGRGFGGFGAGFWDRGAGGWGFNTGKKLSSSDLQLVILALLADKPSHGYELIKALEERSGGFYSPSPGMIYPALSYLEEIGYATVAAEGSKKLYRITDEGRRYLEQNRALVDSILSELEHVARKMAYMRRAFAERDLAGDESDDRGHNGGGFDDLWNARRRIRAALHEKRGCSIDEAQRIAAILMRAAAEILGK